MMLGQDMNASIGSRIKDSTVGQNGVNPSNEKENKPLIY